MTIAGEPTLRKSPAHTSASFRILLLGKNCFGSNGLGIGRNPVYNPNASARPDWGGIIFNGFAIRGRCPGAGIPGPVGALKGADQGCFGWPWQIFY